MTKFADLPDLMLPREIADYLKVSTLTVKRWGNKGKLHPIIINSRGDRRYHKKELADLLQIKNG